VITLIKRSTQAEVAPLMAPSAMFLGLLVAGAQQHANALPSHGPPPAAAQLGRAGTTPLHVVQTLRLRSRPGISKTMFATSNQINSSTLAVEVLPTSVHLWEGAWSPGPLDPPMNGIIPPIKSGACCENRSVALLLCSFANNRKNLQTRPHCISDCLTNTQLAACACAARRCFPKRLQRLHSAACPGRLSREWLFHSGASRRQRHESEHEWLRRDRLGAKRAGFHRRALRAQDVTSKATLSRR
jgi:hypothetical protein